MRRSPSCESHSLTGPEQHTMPSSSSTTRTATTAETTSTDHPAAAPAASSSSSTGVEYRDTNTSTTTPDSSSSSVNGDGDDHDHDSTHTPNQALQRPKMGTRKSSGTIIVPREHPRVELKEGDEVFDADDARAMSPRRSSQDLEKMGQEARAQLNEHAKVLQESLLEIFNRIEAVKNEHDKLDNNNKFLQKYIGDLMSTSKITSTGSSGRKK